MGVTSDSQLKVTIGDKQAGGTQGQLILDSVEVSHSRDNDPKHGVGNDEPQGMQLGNITYEVTASAHLNGAAADLAKSIKPHTPISATFQTTEDADGSLSTNQSELYWNDVTVEAQDGGDVVVSLGLDGVTAAGDLSGLSNDGPSA